MKKPGILGLMTIVFFALPQVLPVQSHPAPWMSAIKINKGAANLTELGNALFQALQANNFDLLSGYLPSDTELAFLKQKGTEDLKAVLETNTAKDIESWFRKDFHHVMQESVSRTLNWSDLSLAEVRAGKPGSGSRLLLPVELRLQTKLNQIIPIQFEALRIQNRYYLFRRMQMKK